MKSGFLKREWHVTDIKFDNMVYALYAHKADIETAAAKTLA